MKERLNRSGEIIANKMKIPMDIVLDIPKIIITGDGEITIENHKGILTFEGDKVRINSKIGVIAIEGRNFEILYIGGYTLTVSGIFKKIIYEEKIQC